MATRFGVLGFGVAGTRHAQAILHTDSAKLVAIASSKPSRLVESTLGVQVNVVSRAELLRRSDIDVISVCTPNAMHIADVLSAVQAEKHVIVEKPLATSMADARLCIAECKRLGRKLVVVYPRRYDQSWAQIHAMAVAGVLPKLLWVDAEQLYYRDAAYYDGWRGKTETDGGLMLTQGIHTLDLLDWILTASSGIRAWTIKCATCANLLHYAELPDTMAATLVYGRESFVTIRLTTAALPGRPSRFSFITEKGNFIVEDDVVIYSQIDRLTNCSTNGWSWQGLQPIIYDIMDSIVENRDPYMDGKASLASLGLATKIDSIAKFAI